MLKTKYLFNRFPYVGKDESRGGDVWTRQLT